MKLLRHLFFVAFACLASLASAFTVLPTDGLWSVVSEQNLAIGRAFNLEMSDKLLVITMYAYNAQGAPTFYVGAAALNTANVASISLSEPQGGTCLGCTPTNGQLLSSPGLASFEFTTSTTGFVTLPGEARKAIAKGAISRPTGAESFRGTWAFSYVLDGTLTVADTPSFTINLGSSLNGSGLMASADGKTGCELQTSGSLVGSVVCVKNTALTITDKAMLLKIFGNRMDGIWYYRDTPGTFYLFTAHRILDSASNSLILKRTPAYEGLTNTEADAMRAAIQAEASRQ